MNTLPAPKILPAILLAALLVWSPLALAAAPLGAEPAPPAAASAGRPAAPADFSCANVTEIPQLECEALVAFYNATGGPNWTQRYGWLQSNTPCSWMGLNCLDGHIGHLNLYDNNLQGVLPPEIGNLDRLTWLMLSGNQLTGLPDALGNLVLLQYLYLSGNQLSAVPGSLANLSQLWQFDLSNNQLASLPESLFASGSRLAGQPAGLSRLQWLNLSNNLLTNLPAAISNLTTLKYLDLDGNQLAALPPTFGNLTALMELHLHNNPLPGEMPASLTGLAVLGDEYYGFGRAPFTFYNTGWCVPGAGPLPAWLAGVPHEGTGMICGLPPGAIEGEVRSPTGALLPGILVNLYRSMGAEEPHGGMPPNWLSVAQARTGLDGSYRFEGLGQGIQYRVHFADPLNRYAPEYYDNKSRPEHASVVDVLLGATRTGVDAVMGLPQAPLTDVDPGLGVVSFNPDGTANIRQVRSQISPITIGLSLTCPGGAAPANVTLTQDPPGTVYPMQEVAPNQYQATIPADQVSSAELRVSYTCGEGQPTEVTVAYITLYDPSGVITDRATGQPIEGASVTLYHVPGWLPRTGPADARPNTCESNKSKAPGAPWSQPAPTDVGLMANPQLVLIAPAITAQQTDAVGYYGWDVSEGCWYVQVAAAGYASLTSPVVGVPPAVTDLDLTLAPLAKRYLPITLRNAR